MVGRKTALAVDRIDIPFPFQLVIGPLNRVGVDGELRGQRPDRRQLLTRRHGACDDQFFQAILDLLIDGAGIAIV